LLRSPKHSSISEPILCRSGQSRSSEKNRCCRSVNAQSSGLFVALTAIVASLFELWEKELGKVSGKSKTAEAIRYALTRREALERFLTDGRIEIDSNIVERAIRPQTITRKNSLFAGSEGGGRTWATVATLLQTAKMNNVDPLRLALPDLDPHCSRLASIRNRSPHALELQVRRRQLTAYESRGHASSVSPLASRSFLSYQATERTNVSPAGHPDKQPNQGAASSRNKGRLILGIGGRNDFGMRGRLASESA
ncbi:Transposase IS66 family protein, partial [Sinorhizobium sp. NFACC03]